MRVLLTAPPSFYQIRGQQGIDRTIPCGAIYALAPIIERHGHEVAVLDPIDYYRSFHKKGRFEALIRSFDVLAMSANTPSWAVAKWMIERAARARAARPRDCRIVLGGVHASHLPQHVLKTTSVDVVVRGDGERTFPQLLEALGNNKSLQGIPGVSYREGSEIHHNPEAAPITQEELDEQPLPAWERAPEGVYSILPVEVSRGCWYGCSFCSIFHKRRRLSYSAHRFEKRIQQAISLSGRFKYKTLMFSDDCFTACPEAIEQVAGLLRGEPEVSVGMQARATDVARDGVLSAMGQLRIAFCQVGAECGYEEGLKRIKKGITLHHLIESRERLRSIGATSTVKYSFIVGFPWESPEHIKRTVAFAFHLASKYGNQAQVNWLFVWPGSEVYEELAAQGLVSPYDFDDWNQGPEFFFRTHPNLTRVEIDEIGAYARHVARAKPWVHPLGSIFDDGADHRHTLHIPKESRPAPPHVGIVPVNKSGSFVGKSHDHCCGEHETG